ncbi:DegV family protein [Gemmiger formicilis]|uniref:DegV family protein n=1 Tax=Gemmiger formicilis TaxID=745368 RepID=UPI00399B1734
MIRIVTDSAADLTAAELNVPGIFVVPLSVTFADGTTQLDDGTMTKDEFFVRLAEDSKLPRTSQPSPASFMQVYEDAAAAGDESLCDHHWPEAVRHLPVLQHLAAADADLCRCISWTLRPPRRLRRCIVREAVRLRDEEGLTAEEISAALEQFKKRVRIVAVVDSLKHLQKGGRLPAAVAIVGGALGIKPVLALQDGAIKLVDKGRGRPGALVAMFKQLDALGGIDPRYGYTLLYSDNKQLVAPVHYYLHKNLHLTGGRVGQIGPTIGTHVGPGVVGVVFVAKE